MQQAPDHGFGHDSRETLVTVEPEIAEVFSYQPIPSTEFFQQLLGRPRLSLSRCPYNEERYTFVGGSRSGCRHFRNRSPTSNFDVGLHWIEACYGSEVSAQCCSADEFWASNDCTPLASCSHCANDGLSHVHRRSVLIGV
jgi:hypothetical protein